MKNIFLFSILACASYSCGSVRYTSAIVAFYNFENFYDTIFGSHDDVSFTPSGSGLYKPGV